MGRFHYAVANVFTLISICDSVFYLAHAKDHVSPGLCYATMSTRVVLGLIFLIAALFLSRRRAVFLPVVAISTVVTLTLLFIGASYLDYRRFVPSLIVHILTLYLYILCLLNELNALYGVVSKKIRATREEIEPNHVNGTNVTNGLVLEEKSPMVRGKPDKGMGRVLRLLDANMMAVGTAVSVTIAIGVAILIRGQANPWSERQIMYVGFIGEVFLRMLKCLVLPLIFSSLVFAIGNIDSQLSGRIAIRAVTFYMSTLLVAIVTGIVLVILMQPGRQGTVDVVSKTIAARPITTMDTMLDLIRNVFASNIFEATFAYYTTQLSCNSTVRNCTSIGLDQWNLGSLMETNAANILGITMFAIVFGAMINRVPNKQLMVNLFRAINDIMMEMTTLVIRVTPVAVTFLILPQLIKVKDLGVMFGAIGHYTLTVLLGIFIQGTITLPIIYFVMLRKNPFTLLKHLSPALVTAFGTSSSSATMPLTFTCLEEGARLDRRIVRFCIPIGSTINMDGTALYEAVAAIFIAQYRNVPMDLVKLVIVAITATAASIGAAGIPQAGLITMIIVLNAVGLPAEDSALIVVIDWMLDRFRTTLNVQGDAFGAAIVHHLSKDEIRQVDQQHATNGLASQRKQDDIELSTI